ncbi:MULTISPECIES: hypothetical protein [unclassified Moorena]|uniref:hypothetical protein n=1 Tax=unclassified Moorena TaxID=2683338 RepID=UPI0013C830DF|nr:MULTISPECIES: hypothetical protein [unclassified Moorena]NEO21959.1 hypothetical protein [Moorena sp. SIO4A5]NEQ61275.1 hypothetical protein [Moorena sp. SIO4A1]
MEWASWWNGHLAVEWASCPFLRFGHLAVEWASCPFLRFGHLAVEWASCRGMGILRGTGILPVSIYFRAGRMPTLRIWER